MSTPDRLSIEPPVTAALTAGEAVVALETALVSHGFPRGLGIEVAAEAEEQVRAGGATPATIGIVDGTIRVGLTPSELRRFAEERGVRKVGPRDLAACIAQGALGATTVAGTLAVCPRAGIRFMGTGGLGGVHRGFAETPDISADLGELARTPALIVSSGVKSLLDVDATAEALETLSVPVLGWRTDTLPLFLAAAGGPPVSARVETEDEAAAIARQHWALGRTSAIVLARPPSDGFARSEAEEVIAAAVEDARAARVVGQELTPFVLDRVYERTDGRSAEVNRRLIAENARLAARVAVAYAAGAPDEPCGARGARR